ncbi:cryptochrome-1 isoform X2 [Patella vulgata]|uniref:cryptochrome-1 isoform X2 n=1 Tax=Patella vulgata TaxID=6465 RepID=UPI0021803F45|nr:cryptochrome-1 isoform X2 [Patella vulgata]
MAGSSCNSIHWFRKGLRLHDNPALLAALENCVEFHAIFILDPWFPKNYKVGINRWRFLLEALQDLDTNLRKLNSRLYVVRGKPKEVFPKLFNKWKITHLSFELDIEPYALKRDSEIEKLATNHKVKVIKHVSHTLYDTERIIEKNGGKAPLTLTRLQTILSQLGPPLKPLDAPTIAQFKDICRPLNKDDGENYDVPTLQELGQDPSTCGPVLYPGGETEGLQRLDNNMAKTSWVANFEKPKTEPNSLAPSTTVLSPYLKFGCVSARLFYWKVQDVYNKIKKHSQPPVSLHGQLLWREFYYTVASVTQNFDKMEGNSVCTQIPWKTNDNHLKAWKEGRTGYPFIDAIMIQLRTEGWIHHLARHAVACFLTRGDLWCHWEEGQKVFEEYLLDADWSLNAGNWMWLSASAFFHQYFRVYSPIVFGKKTDPSGSYIKKYIPVLKKFPPNYIYEPWKAPVKLQETAGCIIGKDYPKPIVDHDTVRPINIKRMSEAYAKNKEAKSADSSDSKRKASDSTEEPKSKKKKLKENKKITDFMK